ncbi:DUF4135 domain-containing protein [Butyrivibrio sp. VCB2001]|uniref:DUF4135 domain-containing protein n=1 Tax=Butyrivibrio sp. VCB2001 TaxID=1280667 RepID=UPI0004124CF9|nr:DUF4135 domain-containing protein [Butyrivibrio sp. VCB2001]
MEPSEIRKIAVENLAGGKNYDFYERFLRLMGSDSIDSIFDGFDMQDADFDRIWDLSLADASRNGEGKYSPFYKMMNIILADNDLDKFPIELSGLINDYCNLYLYKIVTTAEKYYCSKLDNSGKGFDKWLLESGYTQLFESYPVAFYKLFHLLKSVALNIQECITRIREHEGEIFAAFGIQAGVKLQSLECGVSDLHNNGKSVVILKYENGQGAVYKPRDTKIDIAWNSFLQKFNLFDDVIQLAGVKALSYGNYGFCELIKYEPVMTESELKLYYERFGELLCIVSLLGGSDFHHENVMVSKQCPIILDLETLLTPISKREYSSVVDNEPASNEVSLNPSRSLLLSKWVGSSFATAVNIGALTAYNEDHHNYPLREDGSIAYADLYAQNVLDGYEKCYRIILTNKDFFREALSEFGSCQVRFVLRDTRVYYKLLSYMANPKYLHDNMMHNLASLRVYAPFLLATEDDMLSTVIPLIRAEQEALLSGNIPIFYCNNNEKSLYLVNHKKIITDFFQKEPIRSVFETLDYFSDYHLEQELKYLDIILRISAVHRRQDYTSIWSYLNVGRKWIDTDEDCLNFCTSEVDRINGIIDDYILDADNRIYYAPIKNTLNGHYELEVMKNTLYDGTFGVYYFLSMFGKWRENNTEKEMKPFVIKWCEDFLAETTRLKFHSLGLASGIAGVILFLCKESELYNDRVFLNYGAQIIKQISEKDIKSSKESDYFGGLSGLLYVTCLVLKDCEDHYKADLIDTVNLIVETLQSRIELESGLWFDADNQFHPLTGLAHGQTGYILALSSSLEFLETDKRAFVSETIKRAMEYEENSFDIEAGNLPDYRRFFIKMRDTDPNKYIKRFMYGNCSGVVGAAMAYGKICDCLGEKDKKYIWYDRALNFMSSTSMIGNDSLCCGIAAWIDLLAELQKEPQYVQRVNVLIRRIIFSLKEQGYVFNGLTDINDISLYRGITGIGYAYLRLLDDFPCIVI